MTVQSVTAGADCTSGTLYWHYRDGIKYYVEGLLEHLFNEESDHDFSLARQELQSWIEQGKVDKIQPKHWLQMLYDNYVNDPDTAVHIVTRQVARRDSKSAALIKAYDSRMSVKLVEELEQLGFSDSINPKGQADKLYFLLRNSAFEALISDDQESGKASFIDLAQRL